MTRNKTRYGYMGSTSIPNNKDKPIEPINPIIQRPTRLDPAAGNDEVVPPDSPEQPDGNLLPEGRPQRRRGRAGGGYAARRERDSAVLSLRGGQGGEERLPGEEKTPVPKAALVEVVIRLVVAAGAFSSFSRGLACLLAGWGGNMTNLIFHFQVFRCVRPALVHGFHAFWLTRDRPVPGLGPCL